MTMIETPKASRGSGPDGRSVADDLAREAESFGESPATQVDLSQLVEGDHEAASRPGRTTHPRHSGTAPSRPTTGPHITTLFRRLAKERGVDYTPIQRAEVRQATTVKTDCPSCKGPTDLMHTDLTAVIQRHWFRCQRCRRWLALTITFRHVGHGPHEIPNRLATPEERKR